MQYVVALKNHTGSGLCLLEIFERYPTNIFSISDDYIPALEDLKTGVFSKRCSLTFQCVAISGLP